MRRRQGGYNEEDRLKHINLEIAQLEAEEDARHRQELDQVREQEQAATQELRFKSEQLAMAEKELLALREERNAALRKSEEDRAHKEQAVVRERELMSELAEARETRAALDAKRTAAQERLDECLAKLDSVTREEQTQSTLARESSAAAAQLRSEVARLQVEAETKTSEAAQLGRERQDLREQLQRETDRARRAEQTVRDLSQAMQAKTGEATKLVDKLVRVRQKAGDRLLSVTEQLEQELLDKDAELEEQASAFSHELDLLRGKYSEVKKRLRSEGEQRKLLQQRVAGLEMAVASGREQAKALLHDKELQWNDERSTHGAEVRRLVARLEGVQNSLNGAQEAKTRAECELRAEHMSKEELAKNDLQLRNLIDAVVPRLRGELAAAHKHIQLLQQQLQQERQQRLKEAQQAFSDDDGTRVHTVKRGLAARAVEARASSSRLSRMTHPGLVRRCERLEEELESMGAEKDRLRSRIGDLKIELEVQRTRSDHRVAAVPELNMLDWQNERERLQRVGYDGDMPVRPTRIVV
mmetsp:Transcript_38831/g.87153  ORF Transcript_38831/g.87153 Transcript_38831/m.87153 type:complete len:528 (-) Transcript_38831:21-1604(-)